MDYKKYMAFEIIKQLGGRKFVVMTGAKDFCHLESGGISFKLPSNFAMRGINLIKIEVDPSDTYNVYFYKTEGVSLKEIAVEVNVYCDQLQAVFTNITGLDTHLPVVIPMSKR